MSDDHSLNVIVLQKRIAELEAALRDVLPYVDTCNSWHREAQAKGYAVLKGGKDENNNH